MKKSKILIPMIQNASSTDEAIQVIIKTLELLDLSVEYSTLKERKELLETFRDEFKEVELSYRELGAPRAFNDIHEIRLELSYLYTRMSDELTYDVNRYKVYWEEFKTVARANSMLELAQDKEIQGKIKATSTSALRDIYGASDKMVEYTQMYSMAYGLWKELDSLATSITNLANAIAAEEKYLLKIELPNN